MQNDKRKVIVYFVRRWGIVLLLAVTLYCCKNESGTPGKVVIVSTNDMHAQLARFPLLATLIQQKKTEGGEVIVPHLPHILRWQYPKSPQHHLMVTLEKGCARYGT